MPDATAESLIPPIHKHIAPGSELITDAHTAYKFPSASLVHSVIDKTEAYVKDHIHTNGMENFWALLKRMIKGTYVSG